MTRLTSILIYFATLLSVAACNSDKSSYSERYDKEPTSTDTASTREYYSESPADSGRFEYRIDPEDSTYQRIEVPEPVALQPDEDIVKKYENLMIFDYRDTMQVGKTYKATLGLAKNEDIESFKKEVIQSDNKDSEIFVDTTLKIKSTMSAELIDPKPDDERAFKIKLLGDQVQDIDSMNDYKAFWQWSIEPLLEGRHDLELKVEIVVRGKSRNLPSRTVPITIYSEPEPFFTAIGNFLGRNWEWMIGAVLIPSLLMWVNLRHKAKLAKMEMERNGRRDVH